MSNIFDGAEYAVVELIHHLESNGRHISDVFGFVDICLNYAVRVEVEMYRFDNGKFSTADKGEPLIIPWSNIRAIRPGDVE